MSSEARQGERVFNMQCAVCHNAHSTEALHGPGLQGLYHRQSLPSGIPLTDEHVRQNIIHGRAMMPPFGNVLDEQQIDDVIAYLKKL
ncbi:MAG: cytochrome c [Acidobacteriaceae bacterium]